MNTWQDTSWRISCTYIHEYIKRTIFKLRWIVCEAKAQCALRTCHRNGAWLGWQEWRLSMYSQWSGVLIPEPGSSQIQIQSLFFLKMTGKALPLRYQFLHRKCAKEWKLRKTTRLKEAIGFNLGNLKGTALITRSMLTWDHLKEITNIFNNYNSEFNVISYPRTLLDFSKFSGVSSDIGISLPFK